MDIWKLLEKVRQLLPEFYPVVKCCIEHRLYLEETPEERCYHETSLYILENLLDSEKLDRLRETGNTSLIALVYLSLLLVLKYYPYVDCLGEKVLKVLQDRNIILIDRLLVLECVE